MRVGHRSGRSTAMSSAVLVGAPQRDEADAARRRPCGSRRLEQLVAEAQAGDDTRARRRRRPARSAS